jgi:Cu2+-exporting ATPase
MFGAAAMSLSSFIVVMNALRLNLFKPKLKIKDMQTNVDNNKEKNEMNTVVIKIEGMMCPHCSGRVKTVLEAISGVASADVSHERGDAIVTLSGAPELSVLHAAITDAGYKVIG